MKTAAMIISTLAVALLVSASVVAQQMAGTPASPEAATPLQIDAKSFGCIRDMKQVRHFYLDNFAGNVDATLAVAKSATGGTYPPGTVIQLVPQEAMVKREKGASPETHDWEFFALKISSDGTEIDKRGFSDVANFSGKCFSCHE